MLPGRVASVPHGCVAACAVQEEVVKSDPGTGMNRRELVLGFGVSAALGCLAARPASADGKRVALVIGNGAYRNVPTLPNPAHDAGDVAAALKRLGFAVTLITDGSFDQMRHGLIALGRDAADADMAAVFFAGHGMEINGENWLIPIDADLFWAPVLR